MCVSLLLCWPGPTTPLNSSYARYRWFFNERARTCGVRDIDHHTRPSTYSLRSMKSTILDFFRQISGGVKDSHTLIYLPHTISFGMQFKSDNLISRPGHMGGRAVQPPRAPQNQGPLPTYRDWQTAGV